MPKLFFKIKSSDIYEFINSSNSSEEVLDKLFNNLKQKNQFNDWCEKSPLNILYGKRIFKYWPEAKLIHVVRDPLIIL